MMARLPLRLLSGMIEVAAARHHPRHHKEFPHWLAIFVSLWIS
jgi:hypothetical protein